MSAAVLVRTSPITMLISDAPPMIEDDLNICLEESFSLTAGDP